MGNITLDMMTKKDRECVYSLIRFKERYRAHINEQKGRKERKQEKLDLINRSTERRPMPRPTVFRDKSKYDRGRQKALDRRECMA